MGSPSSESVSGSSSRRGLFGRHQQQYNCNTDDNDDDEDDEEHFHLHNTSKPKIIMTRVDDASTQSTIFSDSFRSQRSDYTRQKKIAGITYLPIYGKILKIHSKR